MINIQNKDPAKPNCGLVKTFNRSNSGGMDIHKAMRQRIFDSRQKPNNGGSNLKNFGLMNFKNMSDFGGRNFNPLFLHG